jgi:oxygen-dependent protoporphyrinogen oxidase
VNAGAGGGPAGGSSRQVVVGAGISGLACARRLVELARAAGGPSREIVLLEAGPRPGGVIRTEERDGFLIEGGPDCFITDKPWAIDLCRRIGLQDELIGTNPDLRRSFVWKRGRLLPIPEGFYLLAPARVVPFMTSPILSPAGRLRVACEVLLPRRPAAQDESLASFVRRRFGRQALEWLAQPLVAGIYNADPEHLSLRATFPRFLEMERRHRSVIVALLRARRAAGGIAPPGSAGDPVSGCRGGGQVPGADTSGARYGLFATLRRGLGDLVERLAADLPAGALRTGAPAAAIERGAPDAPWIVRTAGGGVLAARGLVLAVPAPAAAALLRHLDPALADALAGVRYGGAATVSLAYDRHDLPQALRGFGFVVPRAERRDLVACTVSSLKFAGRAPADGVLLRAFLPCPDRAAADPERLVATARCELRDLLGIAAAPRLARAFAHPGALPQYTVGHLERVAAIESRLRAHPGLLLAGNGLWGIGLPDCIRSGERAAESLAGTAGWYPVAR